jgi:ATP-dependent helicase Lhr and Lhr-like helicase
VLNHNGEAILIPRQPGRAALHPRLISGDLKKETVIETLLPATMDRFPWAGHLGIQLVKDVAKAIESARTTLVFCNTRSQVEHWHRALQAARPDWGDDLGIHHGSIDREQRELTEQRLRSGGIRAVVCTSSLDLGVDFSPVEQVIQIGGPKGVARLLQRAGRSGHQPGAVSRVLCVPTLALELVEYAAAREAVARRDVEARAPLQRPLDVLAQHLVTVALGEGFTEAEMLAEVRTAHAYRGLTDDEWRWTLDFITRGGSTLTAYPQFRRVVERDGRFLVESQPIARLHRMSIGTITSDTAIAVRWLSGGLLGTIEESFIARLKPRNRFIFAGHTVELVRVHFTTAYVRKAKRGAAIVPSWQGGRSPLSSQLAQAVREQLEQARREIAGSGIADAAAPQRSAGVAPASGGVQPGRAALRCPEMPAVRPILEVQAAWSRIPALDELLIERTATREGVHHFVYPFGGRLVHEGLGALLAYRFGKTAPNTFTVTVTDYGIELLSAKPLELTEADWRAALSPEGLLDELLACLNSTELARRQFREIARVAGLVFQGFPGANKSAKQLQASSSLFYDTFARYDPQNLLLDQARREVLERELQFTRLRDTLERIRDMKLVLTRPERLTPFAFPLWADMIRGQVSTEKWDERVARVVAQLEAAAPKARKFKG